MSHRATGWSRPCRPLGGRAIGILAALLLVGAPTAVAALPSPGGLPIATTTTRTGRGFGPLALLPVTGSAGGDHEQQVTRLVVHRYQEESDGQADGLRWMQGRYYGVDPNGQGCYLIETVVRQPDGSILWQRTHEPFDFPCEQRRVLCRTDSGRWRRVRSETSLALGYDVPVSSVRAYHMAPNPLPVVVGYWGMPVASGCESPPDYLWHESRPALASRRAYEPTPFPHPQLELVWVELSPYLLP